MQKSHNVYNRIDATTSELVISSNKTGEHRFLVNTAHVELLSLWTWCYEKSKDQPYTMDLSMATAGQLFGFTSPRIYLWKYIAYMHTRCVKATWDRGHKTSDYRTSNGIFRLTSCV
jgi:hypothetical protein